MPFWFFSENDEFVGIAAVKILDYAVVLKAMNSNSQGSNGYSIETTAAADYWKLMMMII